MTKYLFIILCLFTWMNSSSAAHITEDEKEKIVISSENTIASNSNQRSILFVDAYLLTESHIVEVFINTDQLTVLTIIDSKNRIVDSKIINSNNPSIISLSTNGIGKYYLIIESDSFYAEGQFTI